MSISVCIPCDYFHVPLLPACIQSIHSQSQPPMEVIISISNVSDKTAASMVSFALSTLILNKNSSIPIKHLVSPDKLYAGENRNRAAAQAHGDIITFIDADDMMAPNRLEILSAAFSMIPNAAGILHQFVENTDVVETRNFDVALLQPYHYEPDLLHYGHPTFKKSILDTYKYSNDHRGQDMKYIETLLQNKVILYMYRAPLTIYMSNYSTYYRN